MTDTAFHLFVYGSLKSGGTSNHLLNSCQLIGSGTVGGILYDIDGEYRTLVLYGQELVAGEVWRCPWQLLARLDEYENIGAGLFRRAGAQIRLADGNEVGCWIYIAGPQLARKLTPARRIRTGIPVPSNGAAAPPEIA